MTKKHPNKNKPRLFKKWTGKLHLWLGLSVGLIIFIVSITGTLFVFKDEVENFTRKEVIYHKGTSKNSIFFFLKYFDRFF